MGENLTDLITISQAGYKGGRGYNKKEENRFQHLSILAVGGGGSFQFTLMEAGKGVPYHWLQSRLAADVKQIY